MLWRAMLRPFVPALAAAVVVLGGIGSLGDQDTLLELLPLGVIWGLACAFVVWRFGFDREERSVVSRQLLRPPAAAVTATSGD